MNNVEKMVILFMGFLIVLASLIFGIYIYQKADDESKVLIEDTAELMIEGLAEVL